jgi:hypothetical protein
MERLAQATASKYGNDCNLFNVAYSIGDSHTIKLTNEFISYCAANDSKPQKNSFTINISSILATVPIVTETEAANDNIMQQSAGSYVVKLPTGKRTLFDNMPEELKKLKQWQFTIPSDDPKEAKRPYTVVNGKPIKSGVNHKWAYLSFEDANAMALKYGGNIGFCLTEEDDYICIDSDTEKAGVPTDHAKVKLHHEIYEAFTVGTQTYSELSISGKNTHIWIKAKLDSTLKPKFKNKDGIIVGDIDILVKDAWVICTGNTLNTGNFIAEDNATIVKLLSHAINVRQQNNPMALDEFEAIESDDVIKAKLFTNDFHKQLWEHILTPTWIHHSFPSQSEADLKLVIALAKLTPSNLQVIRLFRESGLGQRDKANREDYVNRSIANARGIIAKKAEEYADLDRFIENLLANANADIIKIEQFENVIGQATDNAINEISSATEAGEQCSNEQTEQIALQMNLRFASADVLAVQARAPKFIIDGILNEDACGILGGSSMAFKSFTAFRMAHSICTGEPFIGRQVYETGPVVYICGEGEGALSRRIKGLIIKYGGFNNNLVILQTQISIDNVNEMNALRADLLKIKPKFVIFDTFASLVSSTEENSTSAVGAVLKMVKMICRNADGNNITSSMIVHHFGKVTSAGLRGASSFTNDTDFVFILERTQGKLNTVMSCGKQKDGEEFKPISLKAFVVHLGLTMQNGNEATTLVIDEGDPLDASSKKSLLNEVEQISFDVLTDVITNGIDVSNDMLNHASEKGVTVISEKMISVSNWREKFDDTRTTSADANRMAFNRAKDNLINKFMVLVFSDYACITEPLPF